MQKGKIALPYNRCCDHSYLSFGGGMATEPPSPPHTPSLFRKLYSGWYRAHADWPLYPLLVCLEVNLCMHMSRYI